MIKKIKIWYWERRVQRLYAAYHHDFEDNILEAQKRRNLPQSTIEARNRFNRALVSLKKLRPETKWRPLS